MGGQWCCVVGGQWCCVMGVGAHCTVELGEGKVAMVVVASFVVEDQPVVGLGMGEVAQEHKDSCWMGVQTLPLLLPFHQWDNTVYRHLDPDQVDHHHPIM